MCLLTIRVSVLGKRLCRSFAYFHAVLFVIFTIELYDAQFFFFFFTAHLYTLLCARHPKANHRLSL